MYNLWKSYALTRLCQFDLNLWDNILQLYLVSSIIFLCKDFPIVMPMIIEQVSRKLGFSGTLQIPSLVCRLRISRLECYVMLRVDA